ncbi:serine hydrolase domain-containing protein [Jannaschia aquimarina]|uniref:NylB'_1 protein n=1 Tax=Jannaschia aquimarina TaxID=935700 RepID=A0A0D1EBH5_9RHOB|nr:serine hydrolase [Jannaschia aquimarina]KIT15094.1 6-aminohexanoate-dimer hydrolase [Jannaschia aquimarina]SNS63917.1 CubicO group peptidase, beta-lactamase class C family [Jannaschia aquimarina]
MTRIARRSLLAGGVATCVAAPAVLRAQGAAGLADAASRYDQLHSILVLRGGEEVVAQAFRGPGLDRVANVKSVSKTLLSLLTGIAIDRDEVSGPDAALLPLLGRAPTGDARDRITLGDLLSLRGGLSSTSGPNYGEWVSSGNWVEYALDQPLQSEPGERFIYSTGSTHLLGVALARATGNDLLSLFRSWIGAPLGIDFAPWVADPQGNYLGGNDMGISPRDLARVGQMVLQDGAWNGASVVSPDWIDASWTARARSPWSGDRYGYGWFLTELAGTPVRYARGYGGQILAVAPERDTVIVITSDPMRPARSAGYFGDLRDLLTQAVAAS